MDFEKKIGKLAECKTRHSEMDAWKTKVLCLWYNEAGISV
jgi:hypothetical protein